MKYKQMLRKIEKDPHQDNAERGTGAARFLGMAPYINRYLKEGTAGLHRTRWPPTEDLSLKKSKKDGVCLTAEDLIIRDGSGT